MKPAMKPAWIAVTVAVVALASASARTATDRPYLSPLFTDNMVLQRGMADPVWGWTTPGARVTVRINGRSAHATADADGKWMARVGPTPTGGPYELTVSGPENVTLHNVLVGDVWICSGQSNMEMGIGNVMNAQQEIAAAEYPQIRLYSVQKKIATEPQTGLERTDSQLTGQWSACTPKTIAMGGWNGFTAVGYFFGRDLYQQLHVPIGLIHTSWGGTVAEAWTSAEALSLMPDFSSQVTQVRERVAAQKNNPNITTVLYNGMIAPLIPFGIKGAIWYQGESNAGRAYQYRRLLPTMIRDWRARWGEGDFPFLIVSLANFQQTPKEPRDDAWAELREAQAMTAEGLPNTGLALAIDIGDAGDIHPKNKQEVGRRLALQALDIAYHQHVEDQGPVYRSMTREGHAIRLHFSHVDGGLVAKGPDFSGGLAGAALLHRSRDRTAREQGVDPFGGAAEGTNTGIRLEGFEIAGPEIGADGKHHFVWADARIEGDTVVVSSPQVPDPLAVRYAWSINPVCNLYNQSGLPAVPFRTDTFPGVTAHAQ